MKKSIIFAMITMTLVFSSYVGGFYVGRNHSLGDTQILGLLPESTQPITTGSTTTSVGTTAPVTTVVPSTVVVTLPTIPAGSSSATLPTEPTNVSTVPPTTAPTVPPTTEPTVTELININTATLEQLDTLPGIGPKLAQAIIDYRTEYGPFETPEDLLYVPGIGEKKLAAIIDLITTGG